MAGACGMTVDIEQLHETMDRFNKSMRQAQMFNRYMPAICQLYATKTAIKTAVNTGMNTGIFMDIKVAIKTATSGKSKQQNFYLSAEPSETEQI